MINIGIKYWLKVPLTIYFSKLRKMGKAWILIVSDLTMVWFLALASYHWNISQNKIKSIVGNEENTMMPVMYNRCITILFLDSMKKECNKNWC